MSYLDVNLKNKRGGKISEEVRLSGEEVFQWPLVELWQKLIDINFLSQCVPNSSEIVFMGERKFKCRVIHTLVFMKGQMDLIFEILEEHDSKQVLMRVNGKGVGSLTITDIWFELFDRGQNQTCLRWQAEVIERRGLIKLISGSLIAAVANKIVIQCLRNIKDRLQSFA